jgi:cysteine synthase
VGLDRLFVKDESLNPTNSFKARGQSAAVTRAKYLGATTLSVPSAGNAGNALAAYAACAGLKAKVFLPKDVKRAFERECVLYGADVTLVDGLITDAGRVAAERGAPLGGHASRRSGRIASREKDMAHDRGTTRVVVARLDHLSDRRRHRQSACGRPLTSLEDRVGTRSGANGFRSGRRLRPDRFSLNKGKKRRWEHAATVADGLRVPR